MLVEAREERGDRVEVARPRQGEPLRAEEHARGVAQPRAMARDQRVLDPALSPVVEAAAARDHVRRDRPRVGEHADARVAPRRPQRAIVRGVEVDVGRADVGRAVEHGLRDLLVGAGEPVGGDRAVEVDARARAGAHG